MTKKRTRPPRTQYFSGTMLLLMEKNHINQVQLADGTGIAVSRINNYLHGKYRTIRPDHLAAVAKAVARTEVERSELIRAYLLDLLPEVLQSEIRVESVRSSGRAPTRLEKPPLPSAAADALARLRLLSARSAKARSRLEWFAEILHEAHKV